MDGIIKRIDLKKEPSDTIVTKMIAISNNSWSTPYSLFDLLDSEFNFTFDACASSWNTKCKNYFTKEDNALTKDVPYRSVVWMNPPYGPYTQIFMEWAYVQTKKTESKFINLVPVNTETKWFHEIALKGDVRFIRGRVHFTDKYGKTGRPRFASMIVILDPDGLGSGKIGQLVGYVGGK